MAFGLFFISEVERLSTPEWGHLLNSRDSTSFTRNSPRPFFGAVDNIRSLSVALGTVLFMRWDNLFDDLESQLETELSAEDLDLRAEEERLRLGRLSIRDRLAAVIGAGLPAADGAAIGDVSILLAGGEPITVHPAALGKDWLSGDVVDESSSRHQCIIPLAGIGGVILGPAQVSASLRSSDSTPPTRELSARLSLAFVLRDLCRRRHGVELELARGKVHGTIDRVGRDHIDLALHDRGSPRRESAVRQYRIVPLDQIRLIRI